MDFFDERLYNDITEQVGLVWFVQNVNYYLEIMLAGQEFSVPIVVIN